MPDNNSDANRIRKELEERRQRAKELGVPELVTRLYHDHIKFYPTWFKEPRSRPWIYPLISNVVQLDENRIKFTIKGIDFVFSFTEKWIGGERLGLLEVFVNDKKVFALNMAWEYDRRKHEQQIFDIEDFTEGDWIYFFMDVDNFINKKFGKHFPV